MVRRSFVTVGGVVFFLSAFALVLHYAFPDVKRANDLAGVVQASVAALAIAAGGVFAGYKLQVFRDFEPHLTVTHAVSHGAVGTQYMHVAVTATLKNSSKVRVEIRDGFFRLQQIAPMDDNEVQFVYEMTSNSEDYPDFNWPILGQYRLDPDGLVIEPGGTHHEFCEFVLSKDVESILVHSYFYNMRHSASPQSAEGWTATTRYDVVK